MMMVLIQKNTSTTATAVFVADGVGRNRAAGIAGQREVR